VEGGKYRVNSRAERKLRKKAVKNKEKSTKRKGNRDAKR
jgi:hypothetical protein